MEVQFRVSSRLKVKYDGRITLHCNKARIFQDIKDGKQIERLVLFSNNKDHYAHNERVSGLKTSILGTLIIEREFNPTFNAYNPWEIDTMVFDVIDFE